MVPTKAQTSADEGTVEISRPRDEMLESEKNVTGDTSPAMSSSPSPLTIHGFIVSHTNPTASKSCDQLNASNMGF